MAQMVHTDIRNPIPSNGGDWAAKFGELWKKQAEALKARFNTAIVQVQLPGEWPVDVPVVTVRAEGLVAVLNYLREDPECAYGFLSDLTATDETPREPRFDLVYNLFSHAKFSRIRVKCQVAENEAAPTAIGVWPGANWAEREVFDMFGITFAGHPDLRRILMDERWVGHPLRKDYPLRGYQLFTEPEKVQTELLERE